MRILSAICFGLIAVTSCVSSYSKEIKGSLSEKVEVVYKSNPPSKKENTQEFGDIFSILRRGELVVCSVNNVFNPLFLMKKKGLKPREVDFVGEDIELAKKIAKGLGVRLVFRYCYKSYDDVVAAIERGEGDIGIAKLSYTTNRSQRVLYTDPYVIAKKALLISRQAIKNNQSQNLKNLLNTSSSTIGVAEGRSYEEFAKQLFPKATILGMKDWEKGTEENLSNKTIIATIRDDIRIKLLLNKNPSLTLKFIPIALKGENDYISAIVNFKSLKLLNWINRFLKCETKTKSVDELMQKYEEYIK